jgi:uncharacterized membrane protein YbhN (UPF0104 family)
MSKTLSRKPNIVWNVIKYILAIVLVWFVYSKTSMKDMVNLFESISIPWYIASFVFFFLLTMIKSFQYYLLSGKQTLYPRVISIVVVQNFIAAFVATSAGIASYLTMFRMEENVRLRKSAATFIIAKIGDLFVVWLMLLLTSLLLWDRILSLRIAAITILVAVPILLVASAGMVLMRQKFVGMIRVLISRLKLERFSIVERGVEGLQFLAEQDTHEILRLSQISVLCSLAYMIFATIWAYASLQAFSMSIPWLAVAFVNVWAQLISWLPIQVLGGLGVMETSQVFLYSIFGVSVVKMATISVGLRISLYLFNLLSLLYPPLYKLFQRDESLSSSKEQDD